ncbi:MAG: endonuclease domain-containing protein [Ignavibacteriales bacterium]
MGERGLAFARRLRREMSATERLLWKILRDRRLEGLKFRRQTPIGRYVADFICLRHRLIVEADGPHHNPDRDARRDHWLRSQGFRVMRFTNEQIERGPQLVLETISAAVAAPLADSDQDPL